MMATTSAERMCEHRTRRHRRDIQLKIDVSETELREIALRGYAGAASANRKAREAAVALCQRPVLQPRDGEKRRSRRMRRSRIVGGGKRKRRVDDAGVSQTLKQKPS